MWRSCWPSGACTPITLRCGDGYSVTPRRWNYVCAVVSNRPATVGGSTRPTSGSRVSGCIYTALWTDSTGATIDFLLWAKRDAAAAERFLAKALSGATHPAPRVINTDKHAGYSHLPLTRITPPHHDRKARSAIPTDGQENHLRFKLAPLEQTGN